MKASLDPVGVVEALYGAAADDREWGRRILETLRPLDRDWG